MSALVRRRSQKSTAESGFFTIWILGLCMIIFLFGNISLDLWNLLAERSNLSAIADSAAIAGATQIDLDAFKQSPSVTQLDPAAAIARANDYVNNAAAQDNLVLEPADIEVVNGQLRVTLSEKRDTILTKILASGDDYTITVHSVAEPKVAP